MCICVCVYMLGVGMREGRWGEEVYDVFYLFINIDAMPSCHLFVLSMFQQCKFMNINTRLWLFDVVCLAVSVAIQFILKFRCMSTSPCFTATFLNETMSVTSNLFPCMPRPKEVNCYGKEFAPRRENSFL